VSFLVLFSHLILLLVCILCLFFGSGRKMLFTKQFSERTKM
jgi:hypothetical protein